MAQTQLRSNRQLMDTSIDFGKLQNNFLQSTTWYTSSDNSSKIVGLSAPDVATGVATKGYVDGLVDTLLKAPDGFTTTLAGDYPSDYKGTSVVSEGDSFYITDTSNGEIIGTNTVNIGDLLVALVDNPGNVNSNWLIMESNRELASVTVPGIIELATQAEADAGLETNLAITPATLTGYLVNNGIEKIAGLGLIEDSSFNFNVAATNASIAVLDDSIAVQPGNTNGASLQVTATGLELAPTITGPRAFNGSFSVDSGAANVNIVSGGNFVLDAAADKVVLGSQPTGAIDLSVATIKYVVDSIAAQPVDVFNELPTVTDGNANVTLANTPHNGSVRVYLNGQRVALGATNDFTIIGETVVFNAPLQLNDVVLVDYKRIV